MVEQWTHKPLDVGSNPTLATLLFKRLDVGSLMILGQANPTLATLLFKRLDVGSLMILGQANPTDNVSNCGVKSN